MARARSGWGGRPGRTNGMGHHIPIPLWLSPDVRPPRPRALTPRALFFFLALLPIALSAPAIQSETLTIDAGEVDGTIPAIHGVTNGPVISSQPGQEPPCQNHSPADHSATFVDLQIPQVRTHGGAETDMNLIWIPYPHYAGFSASDENNYDWSRADLALQQIIAVGSQPFLRIGQSKNGTPGNPCDPNLDSTAVPDDPQVFAEVVRHILMHFMSGWDSGYFYDIERVEIWNEFYVDEFWSGTGLEAAALYEAIYNEVKPSFPGVLLGPSINRPATTNPIPSDFWNYIQTHNVPVDFVVPHMYAERPEHMEDRVYKKPAKSWETLFATIGLPIDTPIVNGEWNRAIGCSLEGGRGNSIPGGAFVAASLITMAGMHPDNGPHNLVMSNLFSARSQIWTQSLAPKAPGIGLAAYAGLANDTPERLALSGDYANGADIDFRALAGRSEDGSRLNLLVSYYDVSVDTCPDNSHTTTVVPLSITIDNLPWGNADFTWQRWVHTSNSAMTLQASGSGSGGSFSTSQSMRTNALEVYRLSALPVAVPLFSPWPMALLAALILATGALFARGFFRLGPAGSTR